MKRFTLLLLLILCCLTQLLAQTEKAIYCNDNRTLYFVYDNKSYSVGQNYTADDATVHPIAAVYSEFCNKSYYFTCFNSHTYVNSDGMIVTNTKNSTTAPWQFYSHYIQVVDFQSSFAYCRPSDLSYWFYNFESLINVKNASKLNVSQVTALTSTFQGCSSLTTPPDVSNWNTANVTSLGSTFNGCSSLTTPPDVSHWNTAKVRSLNSTFASCRSLTTPPDVSNWNTASVTGMESMFYNCKALTTPPDVSNWNTANVKSLMDTFSGCSGLTTPPDVSNWNTANLITMRGTFDACTKITSPPDVSNWNTANLTNMQDCFELCYKMATPPDVSNWNTAKLENMAYAFKSCTSWTTPPDVSRWDTRNLKYLNSTFSGCYGLTTPPDVSGWNTSSVESLEYTFEGCSSLTTPPDVSGWDTRSVQYMRSTFSGCYGLTTPPDVSGWNTSSVQYLDKTFGSCYGLTTPPDVSNWNTANVKSLNGTFSGCSRLTTPPDVSGWNTSNVNDFSNTFSMCYYMTTPPDVSGWNTDNATTMYRMFYYCQKLRSLTFGKDFSMDKVTDSSDMFAYSSSLRYIDFFASDDTDAISSVNRTTANTMFNGVKNTTVIYLPHLSQDVTDVVNVVYSYNGNAADLRCPNYYSEDKVDIEFPRNFITNKAEYSRSSMKSTYGSVVLPYAFTTNSDIQAYTLDEEHTETMYFKDAVTIPAHTPFAFKKLGDPKFIMEDTDNSFGITVYATQTTSHEEEVTPGANPIVYGTPYTAGTNLSGWTTKGYYINETVSDYSGTFYIAGDKFWLADGPLKMYPHRVTFHGAWQNGSPVQHSNGAKYYGIEVSEGQVTNAIEAADMRQTEREAQDIYDMQGRRLDSLHQGLNIVRMSDGSVRKVMKR